MAAFDDERPRLVGLAYRILGSLAEAEDVVQEAWLRWDRTDRDVVDRPAAWLTTVTSRLAIDRLRAQRRRREDYVGPWLPEPVQLAAAGAGIPTASNDPELAALRAESLEFGVLVLLDSLGPVERVVFVLADVFAVPYAEIARIVDRSPEACRQLASRARRRLRAQRSQRRPVDDGLLGELVGAIALGDAQRVVDLLAPDVVLRSDGGPHRHAARRPVVQPHRVARLLVNLASRTPEGASIALEQVNGSVAVVIRGERPSVLMAERDASTGAVSRLYLVVNPDKLVGLDGPVTLE